MTVASSSNHDPSYPQSSESNYQPRNEVEPTFFYFAVCTAATIGFSDFGVATKAADGDHVFSFVHRLAFLIKRSFIAETVFSGFHSDSSLIRLILSCSANFSRSRS